MKVACKYCGKMVHEQGMEDHYNSKKCWTAMHKHLLDTEGSTMVVTCMCGCGRTKTIRKADFKRGWGMFFSKSCKARRQARDTNHYKNHISKDKTSIDFNGVDYYGAFIEGTQCEVEYNGILVDVQCEVDPSWDAD